MPCSANFITIIITRGFRFSVYTPKGIGNRSISPGPPWQYGHAEHLIGDFRNRQVLLLDSRAALTPGYRTSNISELFHNPFIDPDTMTVVHIGRLRSARVPQNIVAPITKAREFAAHAILLFRNRERASSLGTWSSDHANGSIVTC